MALSAGTRLGPYEIQSAIGAGGMGEVYRAKDTKLNRDVALKVLPEAFTLDPDRLARFKREAQVLASLNHPNIGAIYGLEESAEAQALVLELVEGPTLADRIAQGPLVLDEALPIARQIAEALEAAHEHRIMHRDLKPANIKLRPDGTVKVLDFGLAKAFDSGPVASDPNSPTITSPAMTRMGVILGTAAYMSPEQAKGRPVDTRTDVWAFGCVLFEMLTGKRAFDGDNVSDTLVAVLRGEPAWASLPDTLPSSMRRLLRRCLDKDPKSRLQHMGDARIEIIEALTLPADVTRDVASERTRRASLRGWQAIAGLCVVAALTAGAAWWVASRPKAPAVTRFLVYPPEHTTFVTTVFRSVTTAAISPDGRTLAFTARDASGKVLLWIRPLDALTAHPLPGTDDAMLPFWSPDSRSIGYFAPQTLLKIAASGGPPQTLYTSGLIGIGGGAWSQDGTIVFSIGKALSRVPSGGGPPSEFLRVTTGQTAYVFPWFLPDGRHFVFYASGASADVSGIYVGSLDSAESKRLVGADTPAAYDPQTGHLLFARQGTLFAQPFNAKTEALSGEPMSIAERVESSAIPATLSFSVSNTGVLAYGAGGDNGLELAWFDRQGKQMEVVAVPGNYLGLDLAPDGKHMAMHRHDGNGGDIWVTDLLRNTTSRFTFEASQENSSPIWSPDGTHIVYGSLRHGKWGLYQKRSDNTGPEEQLLEGTSDSTLPKSWSPDGRAIVYTVRVSQAQYDLWMMPLAGDRNPIPLIQTPSNASAGQISPDGKWLAYQQFKDEAGRTDVYVRPFPQGAGTWQVSTTGGLYPRWRRDGRELFYVNLISGKMMAVDVTASGSAFDVGTPRELFDFPYNFPQHVSGVFHPYAVSADGQRFLIPHRRPTGSASLTMPIVVVMNWADALKK